MNNRADHFGGWRGKNMYGQPLKSLPNPLISVDMSFQVFKMREAIKKMSQKVEQAGAGF